MRNTLLEMLEAGERLPVDEEHWPGQYVAVMHACWVTRAQDRPKFAQVLQWLA